MEDFQDLCTYVKEYTKRISGNKEAMIMTPIDRLHGIVRDQGTNHDNIDFDCYFAAMEEMQCLDMKKGSVAMAVLTDGLKKASAKRKKINEIFAQVKTTDNQEIEQLKKAEQHLIEVAQHEEWKRDKIFEMKRRNYIKAHYLSKQSTASKERTAFRADKSSTQQMKVLVCLNNEIAQLE